MKLLIVRDNQDRIHHISAFDWFRSKRTWIPRRLADGPIAFEKRGSITEMPMVRRDDIRAIEVEFDTLPV